LIAKREQVKIFRPNDGRPTATQALFWFGGIDVVSSIHVADIGEATGRL
jgi:hypothetical protein